MHGGSTHHVHVVMTRPIGHCLALLLRSFHWGASIIDAQRGANWLNLECVYTLNQKIPIQSGKTWKQLSLEITG